MRRFRYIFYSVLSIIFMFVLYISIAYILTLFPHKSNNHDKKEKTIYIYHDSMHTNIIIDIKESDHNWQELIPQLLKNRKQGYISFGFGDKETYINTPTWSDLRLSTALKALFINTPSLIHIDYYRYINKDSNFIKKIKVSKNQYRYIEKRILDSFGKEIIFAHNGYGKDDIFYNSIYKYNLINTCNTWTGDILRDANITMSYWTPFSFCVIDSLTQ